MRKRKLDPNVNPQPQYVRFDTAGVQSMPSSGLTGGVYMRSLLPDAPAYLFPTTKKIEDRIARLFGEAWQIPPEFMRRALDGYWQRGPIWRGVPACRIAVLADWPDRGHRWATCEKGYEIQVLSWVLDTMDDDTILITLAAQLAMVWLHLTGMAGSQPKAVIERGSYRFAKSWCEFRRPIPRGGDADYEGQIAAWNQEHPEAVATSDAFLAASWLQYGLPGVGLERQMRKMLDNEAGRSIITTTATEAVHAAVPIAYGSSDCVDAGVTDDHCSPSQVA